MDTAGNAYVTGFTLSPDFPTQGASHGDGLGFDAFVTKLNASGTMLVYSTYLGGSNNDFGGGITVDAGGNAYLTGQTDSTDFPTQGAIQGDQPDTDAYVTKLSPAGAALVYSTYLGGNGREAGFGVAVDAGGSAYVAGQTSSADFPTQGAFQDDQPSDDAFVTKLSPAGAALVYSTYLGGNAFDYGSGIAVDMGGNAYVTGATDSTDFPTQGALQGDQGSTDAFVTKLSPAGAALVYSTYLGGSGFEEGRDITVDASGNAYATGNTGSTNFPTQGALQGDQPGNDAYVTKLSPTGATFVYSTYLGGNGYDEGRGIATDAAGNAYVTGYTDSTNFPTQEALQGDQPGSDAYVTKLSPTGAAFVYSTYLGGSGGEFGSDFGNEIAADAGGNAYVTGVTFSRDFPTLNPIQMALGGGLQDAFVTKIGDTLNTQPPTVSCGVARGLLWPPNHQLVNIGLSLDVSGDDPAVRVRVFGNNGADPSDTAEIAPGTLRLRSERQGGGGGRVYLIVVTATDAAGQVGFDVCTVVVPHSQSPAAIDLVRVRAAAAAAFYRATQSAPPEFSLLGEGTLR